MANEKMLTPLEAVLSLIGSPGEDFAYASHQLNAQELANIFSGINYLGRDKQPVLDVLAQSFELVKYARQQNDETLKAKAIVNLQKSLVLAAAYARSAEANETEHRSVLTISGIMHKKNDDLRKEKIANQLLIEELRQKAITDPLTGIHNRGYFFESLQEEVEESNKYNHSLSTIMIDLDGFKRANDTYGHAAGNEVLCEVTDRIKRVWARPTIDTFARYGGDEFALILPETDEKHAEQFGEKILHAIKDTSFAYKGARFKLGASIGVKQHRLGDTSETTILHTDKLMQTAKYLGKNCVMTETQLRFLLSEMPALWDELEVAWELRHTPELKDELAKYYLASGKRSNV